jgi:hypothetical protein
MNHPAWEPISNLLNEYGIERVIDTLGRILTLDALQAYESPNEIPQLTVDVINVCAKHRITTAEDLIEEHWLDDIIPESETTGTRDYCGLLEQLLDGLQNDVFTEAPERAATVANVKLIAKALRTLYPSALDRSAYATEDRYASSPF